MGVTIVSFPGYKGFLHGFKFSNFLSQKQLFFCLVWIFATRAQNFKNKHHVLCTAVALTRHVFTVVSLLQNL